jgi:hypothetical protein
MTSRNTGRRIDVLLLRKLVLRQRIQFSVATTPTLVDDLMHRSTSVLLAAGSSYIRGKTARP